MQPHALQVPHPCKRAASARTWPMALLALVLCASSASATRAEVDCRAERSEYCDVVAEAVRKHNAKDFLAARSLFERAHQIAPSARTARALGDVAFQLRRYAEAIPYLEQALDSQVKPLTGALRSEVEQLVSRARNYVATIDLTVEPADAQLLVDGVEVALPLTAPLLLARGSHALEARAPGFDGARRAYVSEGGEHFAWTLTLAPTRATHSKVALATEPGTQPVHASAPGPRAEPMARADEHAPPRWLLPTGALLAGAGVAGIAAGAGRFARYVEDGDALRGAPDVTSARADRWRASRRSALVLGGAGSALLAAGAGMLGERVPVRHRRWLSPALVAAGAGMLATGLMLQRDARDCARSDDASLHRCVGPVARYDRGSFVATVSVPVLTVPVVHGMRWVVGRLRARAAAP